jgi:glycerol-3-phosphate acyltransferase PlsY
VAPTDVFALVAAYVLGSLPVAYLAGRVRGIDIRTVGSGNVGATNAFRALGPLAGVITLVLDLAKGAGAVLVAEWLGAPAVLVAASGACAIAGHVFPAWLGFRGGKGVATAAGVFGVLSPVPTAFAALAFAVALFATRYVSLASLASAAVLSVLTWTTSATPGVPAAALASALLIGFAHRANVGRVLSGNEPRIAFRRSAY